MWLAKHKEETFPAIYFIQNVPTEPMHSTTSNSVVAACGATVLVSRRPYKFHRAMFSAPGWLGCTELIAQVRWVGGAGSLNCEIFVQFGANHVDEYKEQLVRLENSAVTGMVNLSTRLKELLVLRARPFEPDKC
jgi:hypothetical protein